MPIEAIAARIGEIQGAIESISPSAIAAQQEAARTAATATTDTATATTAAAATSTAATGTTSAAASAFESALTSASTPANPDQVTGDDVVEAAKKYLGVPYVFGGEDETGMDCSGLVQRVFSDLGIDMPRVVQDQDSKGTEVASLAEAQPGDLLVPNGRGHILFYLGDGKVLHAPKPGDHVKIADNYLSDADLYTIRRIVPATSEVQQAEAQAPAAASSAQSEASVSESDVLSMMQQLFAAQTGTA